MLYTFEISCLSVASFPIIFSHSEGCLFTLLIVCFDVQKLLRLIRSPEIFFGGGRQTPDGEMHSSGHMRGYSSAEMVQYAGGVCSTLLIK